MSDRLADIGRRVETIGQLRAVVNAMRGIAGARARQAHSLLPAIDGYATTAAEAVARAQTLMPAKEHALRGPPARPGMILFGAEQGFAGGFPEQVLDALSTKFAASDVFLIGSRSAAIATARGLQPAWTAPLPTQARALPDAAAALVDALYDHFARAGAVAVSMVFPIWRKGRGAQLLRQSLLPLDTATLLSPATGGPAPIVNLPPAMLIEQLAQEYLFAQLCKATVEAFAAENEARMATMAAARTHIDRTLAALKGEERMVRQEEITAEVVELAIAVRHARI